MGADLPFRLDLFGRGRQHPDLRRRHPAHASSGAGNPPATSCRLPRRRTAARFRQRFREVFEGDQRVAIYKEVSNGIAPPDIRYWLPLFFEQTATLFSHAEGNALMPA